jgi:hypothetical protein
MLLRLRVKHLFIILAFWSNLIAKTYLLPSLIFMLIHGKQMGSAILFGLRWLASSCKMVVIELIQKKNIPEIGSLSCDAACEFKLVLLIGLL